MRTRSGSSRFSARPSTAPMSRSPRSPARWTACRAGQELDIPIHVDAASGGFVAPFLDPELEWDFRLARVQSINASGHKYGLVYPNLGWVVWREKDALPHELVFEVNYLGGTMPTFALNFSRSGAQVVAQYYTMVRLGRDGFRRVQQACRDTAEWLAHAIADMGPFELISDGSTIPVFAFRLKRRGHRLHGVRRLRGAAPAAAGRCPPTRFPRICRTRQCCGWWCATASGRTWRSCWPATCGAPPSIWPTSALCPRTSSARHSTTDKP